ncbi:hypothetical protein M378DRAFT_161832 [Amanita muscaria Koide BX008]|uniref:Uncharacterized protein n=1 Tax=Amanita muscaria (strain Koide BX008) TaxID=946122 RepID=A0A0C2TG12_AMAMK|nr:hypothetical protein M378DRAFT_161832 [Amanita muscaria Koide BX008]
MYPSLSKCSNGEKDCKIVVKLSVQVFRDAAVPHIPTGAGNLRNICISARHHRHRTRACLLRILMLQRLKKLVVNEADT